MALLGQGGAAIELGQYATARALLEESLALAHEAGDAFRAGHALNSLGDLARCEQNDSAAKIAYEQGVASLREVGAQRDLASALGNLGHVCLHLGDVERAHALFGESMAAHQAQRNRPGMAEALVGFAGTAIAGGLPAAGVRLLAALQPLAGRASRPCALRRTASMPGIWPSRAPRLTAAESQAEEATGRGTVP